MVSRTRAWKAEAPPTLSRAAKSQSDVPSGIPSKARTQF